MSIYGSENNATLGEVIAYLKTLPMDMMVEDGFNNPHSYRGYYEDLSFEPIASRSVEEMLRAAQEALGSTYEGWKGGDYKMTEGTDCWVAKEGHLGVSIVLPGVQMPYVLPEDDKDE